jgi:protein phosphatase
MYSQFRWTSGSRSDAGLVRRVNEDACLDQPERGLWAVADGMGGHTVGDLASRMAVEALSDVRASRSLEEFVATTEARLQTVNQRLRAEAAARKVKRIGSTVAVLLACEGYCAYLWAGDSRIYLYRRGRLTQLTRDHSLLEELRARGAAPADGGARRAAHSTITRAVGATDELELDGDVVEVEDGDVFLLCSDGLSNELSEQEMTDALLPGNCGQASDALVDAALKAGGHDNISAVVVRAEDLHSGDRTLFNPAV